MISNNLFNKDTYPILYNSTKKLNLNSNPLIGRDDILKTILASLHKSEMSNVLLLAEAGGGKTATVQEFARRYADQYIVLETSIAQLEADGKSNLAKNFKELFFELEKYNQNEERNVHGRELVLFIDEFHRLPMESPSAVEDLKPEFARSSQLGIHIIGATTYAEYRDWILKNQALNERFQVLNLPIADDKLTFKILKSRMIGEYKGVVKETPMTDRILKEIIYYTDLYIKAHVQPRKSTDILDQMMGWVRIGEKFDHHLLARVIYRQTHVRIDLQLDAKKLKDELNKRVYNQPLAIDAILGNAYSSILGVNDDTKPRGVFLFVGPTGVGKTELAKAFTATMFGEDSHLTTFDMAEYQENEDVKIFQTRLTASILTSNTPVILLDEIEKANKGIGTLLFSVFDEARLADENGREVNFSNVFFLLTTNAGDKVFDQIGGRGYSDAESNEMLEEFNRLIFRNLEDDPIFPTPLLGRITGYVPFNPMTDETNKKIAKRGLHRIAQRFMEKQNVKVRYDNANIIRYITEEKLDTSPDAGGARQINSIIKKDIVNNISKYLIFHPGTLDVYLTTVGLSRTENKNKLISDERIQVTATKPDIIKYDYQQAVERYKVLMTKMFKIYIKKGLKLSFNAKELFSTLSRLDLEGSPAECLNKFFEPLKLYFTRILEWKRSFGNNPENAPYQCPSTHVKIYVQNNELIVEGIN